MEGRDVMVGHRWRICFLGDVSENTGISPSASSTTVDTSPVPRKMGKTHHLQIQTTQTFAIYSKKMKKIINKKEKQWNLYINSALTVFIMNTNHKIATWSKKGVKGNSKSGH